MRGKDQRMGLGEGESLAKERMKEVRGKGSGVVETLTMGENDFK